MTMAVTRIWPRGGIPIARGRKLGLYELDITAYVGGGGIAITPSTFKMRRIYNILFTNVEPGTANNRDSKLHYDATNSKIFAIVDSTAAEAGAIDLGTYRALVIGG